MSADSILVPGIAMFTLTASVVGFLAIKRNRAVMRGDQSLRFYRLYSDGQETEPLRKITRHVQNHFEVPPIFYAVLLFIHASGRVSGLEVGLAWLFVALRCVHTFIHLGRNDVTHRFAVFAMGGLVLVSLWTCLAVSLFN